MSSVIEWKTAIEMIEILKQQNAMVAGMSVAEAAAALGFIKTASGIYVKTIVTTTATAVTSTTASAAAGGVAGATTSAGNLVLFESAAGGASVGGLSSVAAPVALSIAAGAGGYLVGNKIYEENEDIIDKLMFPIYDFFTGQNIADSLYDDGMVPYDPAYVPLSKVPTIPMIYDQYGHTYMDSRFQNTVKEILDGIYDGLIKPVLDGTTTATPYNFTHYCAYKAIDTKNNIEWYYQYYYYSTTPLYFYGKGNSWNKTSPTDDKLTIISGTPIPRYNFTSRINLKNQNYDVVHDYPNDTTSSLTTYNNYNNINNIPNPNWVPVPGSYISNIPFFKDYNLLKSFLINGTFSPDDLREPFEDSNSISLNLIKYTPGQSDVEPLKFPDEIPQWTPVAIPEPAEVPGTMPTPVEYPDPSPRPEKITPYINPIQPQPENVPIKKPDPGFKPIYPIIPVPNPIPDSSTEPVPPPDATKDPSQELKPILPPQEVPTEIPEPGDTGETPTPTLPIVQPITSSATGLLHVYNPTNAQINEFGSWLWTTFSGDLMETLSKLFNNPMDAVIGLHEIYCTPSTGENSTIKAGFLDSEVPSRLVASRYVNISCGAIGVPEYWNNYLDYAPYTKAYCYLPFIGIVELNADDIVGSGVEISYKIDTYNGSCIAMITTAKPGSPESVTYQFSGNCAVEVPITSGMKSATQGALLGASVAGFAAATVTGGGGAVLGAAAVGGLRGASNSKNSVQYSGSFGSSYGAMGIKTPYLIIKRPKQKVIYGYNENYGYPAHKMVHIAKCSGYLKAIEVDVISPTATEDEKKLIEEQLKSGIFVD